MLKLLPTLLLFTMATLMACSEPATTRLPGEMTAQETIAATTALPPNTLTTEGGATAPTTTSTETPTGRPTAAPRETPVSSPTPEPTAPSLPRGYWSHSGCRIPRHCSPNCRTPNWPASETTSIAWPGHSQDPVRDPGMNRKDSSGVSKTRPQHSCSLPGSSPVRSRSAWKHPPACGRRSKSSTPGRR